MSVRQLISQQEIDQSVARLGEQMSREYAEAPLTVLGVLSGSLMFVADLMRKITVPHQLGLVQASSYRGPTTTPGELTLDLATLPDLTGRDVLLVDDILDTGQTVARLQQELRATGLRSLKIAVLLWKRSRMQRDIEPDYFCFDIPDEFVVGYGLDYNGEYRHLPYIGVLEP
ncbi:MAG: hypoxanthine phosphoribosyltransferase [Planctomycetaceae bacterium]|nr:hypoxanthine phosphoribosyltransferase [Planctomycetaceae bacterium]